MSLLNLSKFTGHAKTFFVWQIELTTRCPLKCRMCIRDEAEDWFSSDMNIEDFRKLTPYFKDVETVVLEGWGESLLHKDILEAIRLVKAEGAQAGFVTSGRLLNREYISEIISTGVDFIGFSLSGATPVTHDSIRINSDLKSLIGHIQTFNEIKKERGLNCPRLHIVYLMLRDNISEVSELPRLAKEIGIDEVVLINLNHITNEWQEGQRVYRCNNEPLNPSYQQLLKEAEAKAKELKINLRRPSLSPIDVPLCAENPLRNLYISVDGEVSPCVYLYPPVSSPFKRIFCGNDFYLERVSFGNAFREPFHAIWNSRRYTEFREYFMLRKKKVDDMRLSLYDMERLRRFEITPLPEPPAQCRTCHKMLGV